MWCIDLFCSDYRSRWKLYQCDNHTLKAHGYEILRWVGYFSHLFPVNMILYNNSFSAYLILRRFAFFNILTNISYQWRDSTIICSPFKSIIYHITHSIWCRTQSSYGKNINKSINSTCIKSTINSVFITYCIWNSLQ